MVISVLLRGEGDVDVAVNDDEDRPTLNFRFRLEDKLGVLSFVIALS